MTNSVKSVAYFYGCILALFSILILILIYAFNIERDDWVLGVINAFVTISIFVLAILTFKRKNNGFIGLKEALKVGLATAAISGIIVGIYTFFHYKYIYPEFLEIVYEESVLQISEQDLPESQMQQAIEMTELTTSPWFFATLALISSLFFGFIISLITGLAVRK